MRHELSGRERECLLWIARGKTYAETGVIIGLTFPSVKTYLDRVRLKLNAVNLPQAVAIAVATGILQYNELQIEEHEADLSEVG
jgi:DNA-binding CsgD family transcriptional regulator